MSEQSGSNKHGRAEPPTVLNEQIQRAIDNYQQMPVGPTLAQHIADELIEWLRSHPAFTGRPTSPSSSTVVATEYILQDAQGNTRATAQVDSTNRLVMQFFNKDLKAFASISESFDGDGVLYLYGPESNCFLSLFAENGNPTIFFFDKNQKILTIDSAGLHSNVNAVELSRIPRPTASSSGE